MNQLEDFRREVDSFLRDHPQSPLDHDQRHSFSGLDYYDLNEDLILEVDIERFPDDEPVIIMQTSTGDTQEYRPWGIILVPGRRFSQRRWSFTVTLTVTNSSCRLKMRRTGPNLMGPDDTWTITGRECSTWATIVLR